ncbi:hypothetical protein GGR56DRAFT_185020 [Xylariaceae sp. FL0804]|nr:hypothetical protein GGR56DRAFT_185020 [Xylariaceae sp. FL0804]
MGRCGVRGKRNHPRNLTGKAEVTRVNHDGLWLSFACPYTPCFKSAYLLGSHLEDLEEEKGVNCWKLLTDEAACQDSGGLWGLLQGWHYGPIRLPRSPIGTRSRSSTRGEEIHCHVPRTYSYHTCNMHMYIPKYVCPPDHAPRLCRDDAIAHASATMMPDAGWGHLPDDPGNDWRPVAGWVSFWNRGPSIGRGGGGGSSVGDRKETAKSD